MDKKLLARVQKQAWFHKYPRGLPLLVFGLTASVTALSVMAIERADSAARRLEMERNTTEIASALQRRAFENIAYLSAAASTFSVRDEVSPLAFEAMVRDLNSGSSARGSMGMGWAPWITAGSIPSFEAETRARGIEGYKVRPRPADPNARLVPITYLEPRTVSNLTVLGYDMYSEPTRHAAIDKAIRLGKPVLSGKVHLRQDAARPGVSGFLIYTPVFADREKRQGLKGFVYSPLRASEFLESASELIGKRPVDIAIYDTSKSLDNMLAERRHVGKSGLTLDRELEIGNRTWVISITDKRKYSLTPISVIALLAGLTIALLLTALARFITRRAADDRLVLEWLSRQAAIRTSLTRELNHRVKNTLANVLSIVALTKRRSDNIDDFAQSLDGRIRALSATHDLLSQSEWSNAPISEIVRSEMAPYMDESDNHVEIDGPEVSLAPNDALSLGLALHELSTNAAKYGALTAPSGKVYINWRLMTPDLAELHWREEGGPPVAAPARRGFGMDLIEKIVAHELHTAVDLQFEPRGVRCTLKVPVRRRNEFELRAAT